MELINFRNVSKKYADDYVLKDVNLTFNKGDFITVLGPNGTGKSTLLKLIIGAISPTSGKVKIKKGARIGYVPQKLNINSLMPLDVYNFLRLGQHVNQEEIDIIASETRISHLLHQPVLDLSGGQTQRVLYSKALLFKPQILALDEPTQGMDKGGEVKFYQLVRAYKKRTNCMVILISHDFHVVASHTDWVIRVSESRCSRHGPETFKQIQEFSQFTAEYRIAEFGS